MKYQCDVVRIYTLRVFVTLCGIFSEREVTKEGGFKLPEAVCISDNLGVVSPRAVLTMLSPPGVKYVASYNLCRIFSNQFVRLKGMGGKNKYKKDTMPPLKAF